MSKTFAERFKGKIEEVHKQGIHQIISSSINPFNSRNNNFQFCYSDNIDKKENQKFAKNAQMNILDFQKNFNQIVNENQFDRLQNNHLAQGKYNYPCSPNFVQDTRSNHNLCHDVKLDYNQHSYPQQEHDEKKNRLSLIIKNSSLIGSNLVVLSESIVSSTQRRH